MRTKPSHLYLLSVSCLLTVLGLPSALPLPAPCSEHEYRDPWGACAPCPRCPPGQEPDQECGSGRGGAAVGCRPCPEGRFSAAEDRAACAGRVACVGRLSRAERRPGSATADAECGPCLPGFYSPRGAGETRPKAACLPCSGAPPGTAACDGGTQTAPILTAAPATETLAHKAARGGAGTRSPGDPAESPHENNQHHHQQQQQQRGGRDTESAASPSLPEPPGPADLRATETPRDPTTTSGAASDSAAVAEATQRPLPDFGFFVLVPVFGLTGLLGVLVCHTLKARRVRGSTDRGAGGGTATLAAGAAATADCKGGAGLLLPSAQYHAGNEDTIGQLVNYFLHKNGNLEALQALAMERGQLEATDSMASGFCSPADTPRHCQLPPRPAPQSPPAGWQHAHTVHASQSRCACTRCRHALWAQLPWPPAAGVGGARGPPRTPSRQGRPADAASQAIGRFRVSQIPEQREWGSAAEQKKLLEMSDSDGDDSASGHLALDNPGGPGAPQSHHPLPRAQTDTKLCLRA